MTKKTASKKKLAPEKRELTIDHLNSDGLGVSSAAGKPALVWGGLPGEKVRVVVEHQGQHRDFVTVRRVLTPSDQRRPPICAHLRQCRGCPFGELDYAAQLDWKRQRVRSALASARLLEKVEVEPVWGATAPLGYRTTVKLAVAVERGQLRIGLYQRGSHQVVDIGDCPLHHPLINRIIAVAREEIARQKIPIYNPRSGRGLLRYLLVRVSPTFGKALVTLVTSEREFRHSTHLAKWLQKKVPEIIGIHQNVNASEGNVILGREFKRLVGGLDLRDRIGDIAITLKPGAFFQVNHSQAERIYRLVRQWALPRKTAGWVIDLYCGIGGIALHLAPHAARVIGIEVNQDAVSAAEQNARANGIGNCRFYAGDSGEILEDLKDELTPGGIMVVNPPRSGCSAEVLRTIADLAPRRLVYVSCNPDSLARDLAILREQGLHLEAVQPVDMFPQTAHIETVARLTRG